MFMNDQRRSTTRVSHNFRGFHRKLLLATGLLACLVVGVERAAAQFELETLSDGTDGVFNPAASIEVDLSQALTGPWDTPIPAASMGKGIYDSAQWAVVFKYSEINIPTGVTVTFKNHPSGAPVVWLVQKGATATIAGVVSLNGKIGTNNAYGYAEPGPGGFAGGVKYSSSGTASSGFGPGAGRMPNASPWYAGGAGHQSAGAGSTQTPIGPTYGESHLLPLIGGSGGSGSYYNNNSMGGGGGGGAILFVASAIVLDGRIEAKGGNGGSCSGCNGFEGGGGGSGGSVRLVADSVNGAGNIQAPGGSGGNSAGQPGGYGWLRIEATEIHFDNAQNPGWAGSYVWSPVFPPANAPTLRIVSVDGQPVADEPLAGVATTEAVMGNGGQVPVVIQATNIPTGKLVKLLINPARGQVTEVLSSAPGLQGTLESSTVTIMATIPAGRVELQARANW